MSGYDAPIHLSEECIDAENDAPKAIIGNSVVGAVLGWFAALVIAYTVSDVKAVIGPEVDQPMVSFLLQVVGKETGLVVFSFIIVCCIFEGQACMIISSRLVSNAWFRDRILPGSQYRQKIRPRPVLTGISELKYPVCIDCLIGIAFNSLVFGGPEVVGAIFSVGVTAQYFAFVIPIALRLIFPGRLRPGRWTLGKYSHVVGIPGILWGILVIPVLSFPAKRGSNLTPTLMNWTGLVYGGAMLLALIWYAVDARKWFTLPRRVDEDGWELAQGEGRGHSSDAVQVDLVEDRTPRRRR